jgi:hypothetical protein
LWHRDNSLYVTVLPQPTRQKHRDLKGFACRRNGIDCELPMVLELIPAINLQAEPVTESKKFPAQPHAYLFPAKYKKLHP